MTEKLYHLPWTEKDNPNGWIEPTTHCQLKCPGCYRGADKENHVRQHLELSDLKQQVDWFVQNRNVHTISLAGGEPLLYPHIDELISYIASKKCRSMLYTNGVALSNERIKQLKTAGLTQVVIHIDRFQERPDLKKNATPNTLREKFCSLFREIKDIRLGFIQPVSLDCFDEVKAIMQLAQQNIDVVNLIVFTLYREICWNDETKKQINTEITTRQLVEKMQEFDNFKPAAFLPSTVSNNDPTWLFGIKTGVPEMKLGYFSPDLYQFSHERYRNKYKRHLFISRNNEIKPGSLLKLIFQKNIRSILKKWYSGRFTGKIKAQKLYFQTFLILRGPLKNEKKWDLCQGCPDRMLYEGKLVPSCILEDLKNNNLMF